MRLLLDTHAFLWFILNDAQLNTTARTLISDPSNQVEISPASYWEIAIKISVGKYQLVQSYQTFLNRRSRPTNSAFCPSRSNIPRFSQPCPFTIAIPLIVF
jgi:PIN domain nuclease of toxin-antitoxin system